MLLYAATYEKESIKERWYEKLHRWDEALSAYERRQLLQGEDADVLLGRMRCMKELQQWERLAALGSAAFLTSGEESTHALIAPLLSSAMHQLRYWGYLEPYLPYLSEHSYEGCFYRAVYAIHVGDYAQAQRFIDSACECVDGQLGGLVGESYSRAYGSIVRLQQCTELSEIISYKAASDARKAALRKTWSARLRYAQKSVGVWSEILSVRALVMTPTDDEDIYLEYAKLARKSGKLGLSLKVLTALVGFDPTVLVVQPPAPLPSTHPQLTLACLKHLYMVGYRRMAYNRLSELVNSDVLSSMEGSGEKGGEVDRFKARCYLKLGGWQMDLMDGLSVTNFYAYDVSHSLLSSPISLSAARRELEQNQSRNAAYNAILPHVLNFFHAATVADPTSFKAWHQLAMMNFSVVQRNKHMQHHYNSSSNSANTASSSAANSHRGSVDTTKRGSRHLPHRCGASTRDEWRGECGQRWGQVCRYQPPYRARHQRLLPLHLAAEVQRQQPAGRAAGAAAVVRVRLQEGGGAGHDPGHQHHQPSTPGWPSSRRSSPDCTPRTPPSARSSTSCWPRSASSTRRRWCTP